MTASPTPFFADAPATASKMEVVQPAPDLASTIATEIANLPWARGLSVEEQADHYGGMQEIIDKHLAPILAEKERAGLAYAAECSYRAGEWQARALAAEAALAAVRGAAQAVLVHRVGDLPTSGYLRDNGASRQALASLAAAIRAQGE